MMTTELGECVICKKEALFSCLRCKRVNYCSASCQSDNQCRGHDEICEPKLGDMFQRLVDLHCKDHDDPSENRDAYLSITVQRFCIKGKWIEMKLSLPLIICVVCSGDVTHIGSLKDREFFISREDGVKIHCHRCDECEVKGRMICKKSLYDNQACPCHIDKAIYFMLNDVFPYDLTREICIFFNKVKCVYAQWLN
jgi:hypothetical protein